MKNSRAQYGLLLASVVLAVVAYPRLPSRVPIHYDYSGHANGFVDKPLGAFALPLGLAVLHMVMLSLRAYTVDASAPGPVQSAWNITHAGVLSAGFVTFGLPYAHALDLSVRFGPCLLFAVAILCMSVGTASYSLQPNVWLGLRTRAALYSPEHWYRIHTRLAYLLWIGSILLLSVSIVWSRQ